MKGIASHGAFNLEQLEVYVDVKLASTDPNKKMNVGVVPSKVVNDNSPDKDNMGPIWKYIDRNVQNSNKLILVGSPGSGKTTVLKQIVLAFCKFRSKYNLPSKIPILLFLRSHVPDILNKPEVSLISLIRSSMSKGEFQCKEQWFERKLKAGQCVILLDGVDEIGDLDARKKVVSWIEKTISTYSKNHFIVTSRPHGVANSTITGTEILQIQPLDVGQIENFIHNWYLATEKRLSQSDDAGVRMIAKEGAQDLLSRIQNTDSLHPLAQNGLLLTMIATLHRFDAQLPGRRVELYEQIFQVFFRRRDLLGGNLLTPDQTRSVLMPLASYMMERRLREISLYEAASIIQKDLTEVIGENIRPDEFLRSIQEESGLLLEVAQGVYSFASLTFQEYLTSAYYVIKQNTEKLVSEIQQDWWWETIRLFCAQSDGTRIIEACLAEEPIRLNQLELAISCLEEALRVEVDVRARLNEIIRQGVDNPDPKWRNVIATALLLKRLRFMDRIDARRLIDNSLVTNVEYQIFLDQKPDKENCYPDHWAESRFPDGTALDPVTGVRISDVQKFTKWLVPQDIWRYQFRIPDAREISIFKCETNNNQYWLLSGDKYQTNEAKSDISTRYKEYLIQQLVDDTEVLASIRAAVQREKNTKPISELLAGGAPIDGRVEGHSLRSSFDMTGEIRAIEVQKGEQERLKQWGYLQRFRKYFTRINKDFDHFLDSLSLVSIIKREQVQSFDWIPAIPYPPDYGIDLEKEILKFNNQYPPSWIRSLLGRNLEIVIQTYSQISDLLLNRSWPQLLEGKEERGEIYLFVRLMIRICLLSMALAGKSRHPSFSRDIANLYLLYCILERRIAGKDKAVEGIRLVKFS